MPNKDFEAGRKLERLSNQLESMADLYSEIKKSFKDYSMLLISPPLSDMEKTYSKYVEICEKYSLNDKDSLELRSSCEEIINEAKSLL